MKTLKKIALLALLVPLGIVSCKKDKSDPPAPICFEGIVLGETCCFGPTDDVWAIQVDSMKLNIKDLSGKRLNVIFTYTLPDSLKISGEKIYFNFKPYNENNPFESPGVGCQQNCITARPYGILSNASTINCNPNVNKN